MNARNATSPAEDGAHRNNENLLNPSIQDSPELSSGTPPRFSIRWGIPLMDEGWMKVPNFFLKTYAAAGLTRTEFVLILHLASYQWELAGSESRPAIGTVAREAGLHPRSLQKLLSGLEARGFLERQLRPGRTTVYDFTGLSRTLERLHRAGGEPSSGVGVACRPGVGVAPRPPEEESYMKKQGGREPQPS